MAWLLAVLVVLGLGWIRLAPSDPARWHQRPEVAADRDMKGGVLRAVTTGPEGLARLDTVVRAAPRTRVLAGSVGQGMVTYVTRSRVFGFPDYTTAWQDGATLRIWARLRFGRSDLGVNRDRVDQWLAALGY
ncbi:DUF1499 domain-containing protein [Ruegeria aquimaris]|uniref:DUF1499 domain-containing protein n=1 Tax=Ruegeria aquimaris TaxID=2984333 RepID=A0ABT3AKQ0_9RHOB|nr:DUF1499 domain-containing protein [Ruegeria sp. XHP0148]MCV2889257.1 DUF1499 domain-containing protein [Ruegeria sp. XHP0148]